MIPQWVQVLIVVVVVGAAVVDELRALLRQARGADWRAPL